MKQETLSLKGMVYASMFGAITALGAYIIIPFPLVPITMQTFFVSLAAALLGGRLGALSQVVYVLIGILGFPVFAGGKAGLGVLLGPTGGYLVGFVVGAYIIGRLIETRETPGFVWMVFAMLIGHIALYALGVTQLMLVAKLSFVKAMAIGVIPTLPGGLLKILGAAFVALKVRGKIRIAVLLLAVFLTACAGNDPYPPEGNAQIGYAALAEDPRTLDPAQVSDTTSAEILTQIYDSLYQNVYLDRPYKVEPALAAGYPEKRIFQENVEEKGIVKKVQRMEYVVKLRDDIFFQDDPCFPNGKGRRVVAEDVIYAIKRLADPTVQSTGYWLVAGKIKGIDEFFKRAAAAGKADYGTEIEGLAALDEGTVKIILTEPYPAFIFVLSMPYTAPVAREAVAYYSAPGREGFARHPVGTGAYRLKSWKRQHRIVLEKNPTFRKEYYPSTGAPGDREKGLLADAGEGLPFLDEVWYTIISAGQPAWLLFQQGYLDASGIPQEQFDRVVTKQLELSDDFIRKGINLEIASDLDIYYIAFNMRDPVLGKNRHLRQALSLAYDSDLYNEIYLNGRAINAQGPLPPGVFGYDRSLKNPYKAHDLAKAKEFLAKAGYPGGIDAKTGQRLELTYDIGSDSTRAREAATFDMRCFEQLGIRILLEAQGN